MRQHIVNYFLLHFQAAVNSLGQFSRTPFASLMTCFVIGIALALPTALFVTMKNLAGISGNLHQTMQLTLYLKPGLKESEVNKLLDNLQTNPLIVSAEAISPAQGLKELQQQAGFSGALEELPSNPLPWTIVILPHKVDKLENLTEYLEKLPGVDSLQLDALWVKRLASLMKLVHRVFYALAIFFGIAVLFIVNNAIRSTTQQNQKEIEIIKLIGGTNAFIRRPFLYAGMIYGLLGGIIAWQFVDILLLLLKGSVHHLANLYDSQFELFGIGFYNTLILLGVSILLGLIGSWLATTRQLKIC